MLQNAPAHLSDPVSLAVRVLSLRLDLLGWSVRPYVGRSDFGMSKTTKFRRRPDVCFWTFYVNMQARSDPPPSRPPYLAMIHFGKHHTASSPCTYLEIPFPPSTWYSTPFVRLCQSYKFFPCLSHSRGWRRFKASLACLSPQMINTLHLSLPSFKQHGWQKLRFICRYF